MKSFRLGEYIFAMVALLNLSYIARGDIVWNWSDAETGLHSGTFTTTGNLVDGNAIEGAYTILDFTLEQTTSSMPLGSMSDGTYVTWDPDMEFHWDGTKPVQFARSSGQYHNGINISRFSPTNGVMNMISMDVGWFEIRDSNYDLLPEVSQNTTISLEVIPEPTSCSLIALGAVCIFRLRKFKRSGSFFLSFRSDFS